MTDEKIIGQFETLRRQNEDLQRENLVLRGLLALVRRACVHCGLEDMSRCPRGFPGCAQADDLLAGTDEGFKAVVAERDRLRLATDQTTTTAAIRAFVGRVNARAEIDILQGNPVTGAHHRALEEELRRLGQA